MKYCTFGGSRPPIETVMGKMVGGGRQGMRGEKGGDPMHQWQQNNSENIESIQFSRL